MNQVVPRDCHCRRIKDALYCARACASLPHPPTLHYLTGGMPLVRPVVHCYIRNGRRSRAAHEAVPNARAFCAAQAKRSFPSPKTALSPCLANVPKTGPLQAYAKLVLEGKITEDKHQVKTLHLLQKVRVPSANYVSEGFTAVFKFLKISTFLSMCADFVPHFAVVFRSCRHELVSRRASKHAS